MQNRAIDFSTFGDEEIYCPLITLEIGGGRLAFHENAGFSEERRGMLGMETNARADFSGEREAGGVHVSGCKYNRRVSRGEVKWPWRAVVHAE